jgi:hypothetical protein
MISTTEGTSDITRSFFLVALICQVVTCAFDASQLKMAVVFAVPVSLAVCTLGNVPFMFGLFLVIWGRF